MTDIIPRALAGQHWASPVLQSGNDPTLYIDLFDSMSAKPQDSSHTKLQRYNQKPIKLNSVSDLKADRTSLIKLTPGLDRHLDFVQNETSRSQSALGTYKPRDSHDMFRPKPIKNDIPLPGMKKTPAGQTRPVSSTAIMARMYSDDTSKTGTSQAHRPCFSAAASFCFLKMAVAAAGTLVDPPKSHTLQMRNASFAGQFITVFVIRIVHCMGVLELGFDSNPGATNYVSSQVAFIAYLQSCFCVKLRFLLDP